MKKYIFIALAAIAALSSCNKENLVSIEENGKESQVFTATMEDCVATKATFDGTNKCALWEIGDKISIDGHQYTATSVGASSTFVGEGATETTHHAYFPASLYNGGTPTLPATVSETWEEGKFNMPMYAESSTLDLSFKNLCGVLKITVTDAQLNSVKCITVSSTNCATSGAFTVDANNAAVLTEPSKTANTVTVTYTDAVDTDENGVVFYVAIPAQTYQNLSIAVSGEEETTMVMTTNKDQTIVVDRNTIYPITFNGQPTKGTAERTGEIDDVEVEWVQLWAGGPKFAVYNVGAENNAPEDYGGYYAWGGSIDNVDDHNTTNTGSGNLSGDDDTATKLWGNIWRMPKQTELQALIDNCNVELTTVNGKNGSKFTGKGAYASNSIFLPAAGSYVENDVLYPGECGYYWSSTPYGINYAYGLSFEYSMSGSQNVFWTFYRPCGYSVRAVLKEPTTGEGTAKATINSSEVDVNWVQLWAGGPKFAEYNVGASSATEVGSTMTFTDATKTGSDYVWGANWCTPSKDQMDELVKATTSEGSEKVKCEIVKDGNGIIIGFKFTGKETGYTGNSVFFPAKGGNSSGGGANYWSASTGDSGSGPWYMFLFYDHGMDCGLSSSGDQDGCLVRPVLKN